MPVLDADNKRRDLIIWSTLPALFLDAPNALVMTGGRMGALSQTPLQVGYAMLSLSFGWSGGSLVKSIENQFMARKTKIFNFRELLIIEWYPARNMIA